ncbi:MAG TPA: ribonuclease III [Bacteroidales bacterium]|nr:ribonuclease III [Bacteroidales bacterium]HQP03045.1 ribonuclease III [Bacteroidales bacterium]
MFLKTRFSSFFNRKTKAYSYQLYKLLGFYPKDIVIYQTAFRHISASLNSPDGVQINNERLEFVGDAILDAVVADILFTAFPEADEGNLTMMRSQIVKRKSLDYLAHKIGITDFLIYRSKSENDKNSGHIAGNALEALIGAIYFDQGYLRCHSYISAIIKTHINITTLNKDNEDYKSLLLQEMQRRRHSIVFDSYENIEDCEKEIHYSCAILVNNVFIAEGKAWTKKEAEQEASRIAVRLLLKADKTC